MDIVDLELNNFRTFDNIIFKDFKKINIIIGSNGIGKTSVLESIFVGSLTKTFKNYNDNVLIKLNKTNSFIKINLKLYQNKKEKKIKLKLYLTDDGKKAYINENIVNKLSEYVGEYKVILFSPDELKIIKDSPNSRRSYLNMEISQIDKEYIKILNSYNVLIKNKNDYLKKLFLNNNYDKKYLDVIDAKIAEFGKYICSKREDYLNKINQIINQKFNKFKKNDNLFIEYKSDFKNKSEDQIIKLLKSVREKEMNFGLTSTGIHRDDYEFIHNEKSAKDFSSQGLQKLIILSMKLSEIEILNKYYKIQPILLLDDLFSELDLKNQNKIFSSLNKKLQIFITTTDLKNINKKIIKDAKIIKIEKMVKKNE